MTWPTRREHRAESRRRLTCRHAASTILLAVLLAGCGSAPASVLDERLVGGRTIADVVARDRATAVLVYPLGYCFACAPQIAQWQQFQREGRVQLVVVLEKEPSETDKRALAVRRIELGGVLATPIWRKPASVPREYLVEDGRVTRAAVGVKETGARSLVLQEVASRPLVTR